MFEIGIFSNVFKPVVQAQLESTEQDLYDGEREIAHFIVGKESSFRGLGWKLPWKPVLIFSIP